MRTVCLSTILEWFQNHGFHDWWSVTNFTWYQHNECCVSPLCSFEKQANSNRLVFLVFFLFFITLIICGTVHLSIWKAALTFNLEGQLSQIIFRCLKDHIVRYLLNFILIIYKYSGISWKKNVHPYVSLKIMWLIVVAGMYVNIEWSFHISVLTHYKQEPHCVQSFLKLLMPRL